VYLGGSVMDVGIGVDSREVTSYYGEVWLVLRGSGCISGEVQRLFRECFAERLCIFFWGGG